VVEGLLDGVNSFQWIRREGPDGKIIGIVWVIGSLGWVLAVRQEAVYKRRPQLGGRGVCPVRTFFGQGRGSSDTDVSTFWRKTKFMVYPYGKGGGVNFSRFCADVFYRRPPTYKMKRARPRTEPWGTPRLIRNERLRAPRKRTLCSSVWQKGPGPADKERAEDLEPEVCERERSARSNHKLSRNLRSGGLFFWKPCKRNQWWPKQFGLEASSFRTRPR